MNTKTIDQTLKTKLTARVLDAWQSGHGGSVEKVHLLIGDDSFALIIPKALYQAETVLFNTTTHSGKIVDQYLRSLLDTISDDLLPDIEEYTGKKVADMVPLIDPKAGYITALYRFKSGRSENLEQSSKSF